MEEKRKKFGMELAPSLKKRLKSAAVDQGRPLWALTHEALTAYLDSGTAIPQESGGEVPPNSGVEEKLHADIKDIRDSLDEIKQRLQVLHAAPKPQIKRRNPSARAKAVSKKADRFRKSVSRGRGGAEDVRSHQG